MQDTPVPLTERKCWRTPGGVLGPAKHTSALQDLYIWDHMFLSRCCQRLTIHQFTKPPPVVLDLGCGSGFWAIEAAKQWKESTIIGLDNRDVQPDASLLGLPNVRWVLGNFLEMLPFEADQFDLVRISGIGLCVPEDQWQFVLEEVFRVMKPGAILEIIEDDLIFPCGPDPEISTELGHCYSPTSPIGTLSDGRSSRLPPDKKSNESMLKSPSSSVFHIPWSTVIDSIKTTQSGDTLTISSFTLLPDHTKLKRAWDAMLNSHFLAKTLTTVLSFYVCSTFKEVRTHDPLRIPLPPNWSSPSRSTKCHQHFDNTRLDFIEPEVVFRLKSYSRKLSMETTCPRSAYLRDDSKPRRGIPQWSAMHLAKTVQTVIACKEAIWVAYDKLFRDTLSPVHPGLTGHGKNSLKEAPLESLREEFEQEWSSWEKDMLDRMGMRQHLATECLWYERLDGPPDWKMRLENLDIPTSQRPSSPDAAALCRSLRCFICWKPLNSDPTTPC